MSTPRSGDASAPRPPTARDRAIIRDVLRHGQMTRHQIQRLHFRHGGYVASFQAVCRRLALLTAWGYLSRARLPVPVGSGPFVYQVGPNARLALGEEPGDRLPARRRVRTAPALAHRLEIVDFYIALREALEGEGAILTWLGESEARFQGTAGGRRLVIAPDAYCLWRRGGAEGVFFLEWDRGTESLARLADKLTRYDRYYAVELYHDHLGEEGLRPRLLFVVPDARRAERVRDWLVRRRAQRAYPHLPTVLIGRQERVQADPLGWVWERADGGVDGPVRLVD